MKVIENKYSGVVTYNSKDSKNNFKNIIVNFDSIYELINYVEKTPTSHIFENDRNLSSIYGSYDFTMTNSFEEAIDLFKNGWQEMAVKLTKMLKVKKTNKAYTTKTKSVIDVAGFQPVVPLYLNDIPQNMIRPQRVAIKDKVITISKCISYPSFVGKDEIVESSLKALEIVQKLEAQGYRVNINVISAASAIDDEVIICRKVRIKSANEKLNISKLAFPLVHPSMLRRIMFRFLETFPMYTKGFTYGYGTSCSEEYFKSQMGKNEYFIPSIIKDNAKYINTLEDLKNITWWK